MICEHCRKEANNSAHICPHCGSPLRQYSGQGGIAAMRQGRAYTPPPVYGYAPKAEPTVSGSSHAQSGAPMRDNRRAGDSVRPQGRQDGRRAQQKKQRKGSGARPAKASRVNRALLLAVLFCLMMMTAVVVLTIGCLANLYIF